MTWWEGAILGLVQGATEFLPVSSSGHLVAAQAVLGIRVPGVGLEASLHLATLASVVVVYRRRLGVLVLGVVRGRPQEVRYAGLLLVASVPAGVVGLGFGDVLASLFEIPAVTGFALLATGFVVWSTKAALARRPAGEMNAGVALTVGLAQAAAIVPGVSRSGATVATALWRGVRPSDAATFSFLASIPLVAGAALLEVPAAVRAGVAGLGVHPAALGLSAAVACATGVAAIGAFRAMLARRSFHLFAPYLWVAGSLFLGWLGVR